jgi:hypothetical protein
MVGSPARSSSVFPVDGNAGAVARSSSVVSGCATFTRKHGPGSGTAPAKRAGRWPCLFRLLAASDHQKLLRTAKHSAFQPASIKFVGAKTIQNQHKHIIG